MRKFSFILFLLISITLFAEGPAKMNKQFFRNYLRDTKNIVTSPSTLITDFLVIGGLGATFLNAFSLGFSNAELNEVDGGNYCSSANTEDQEFNDAYQQGFEEYTSM